MELASLQLSSEQKRLLEQSMKVMDKYYDSSLKLLDNHEGKGDIRGSTHYALGLLLRKEPDDLQRACEIITRVIELQYDAPEEIYHGTYKVTQNQPDPPAGNMPWKTFSPGFAYYLDITFEKIKEELTSLIQSKELCRGSDTHSIAECFDDAVDRVLPKVWKSYDPNWREFIALTFAVILEHFEASLPQNLVRQMDSSVIKAVEASMDRYFSDAIPMNTNILLMHIFITGYFGQRYGKKEWVEHAEREGLAIYNEYMEFRSFAEFNSSTYYGVDLMTLGLWRKYLKSEKLRKIGVELQDGLWENIALFYNPNLENLSGPFSRCYEMDITKHSALGVFIYMALGDKYRHLTGPNCETSHNPLIILAGSNLPNKLKPGFTEHTQDRQVEQKFRELCERGKPGENRSLCTATAWIEKDIMLGAMSGSKNTNGQLHPVTIFWKRDEKVYSIRLLRRLKNGHWGQHLRGITYNAKAQKDLITLEVKFDIREDVELFFEISGANLSSSHIAPDRWDLPGLRAELKADAPKPAIITFEDKLEVIYLYDKNEPYTARMTFDIHIIR